MQRVKSDGVKESSEVRPAMLTRYLSYACVDKAFLFLLDACLLPQAMSAQTVHLFSTRSVFQGQALSAPAACCSRRFSPYKLVPEGE